MSLPVGINPLFTCGAGECHLNILIYHSTFESDNKWKLHIYLSMEFI